MRFFFIKSRSSFTFVHTNMAISYYKLPLQVGKITTNEDPEVCTIEQSIVQFIHLIATTHFGEYNYDTTFGCTIWNIDFDNLTSTNRLKYIIGTALEKTLYTHEKRLTAIAVNVTVTQDEYRGVANANRVKKRVEICVDGIVKQTNEAFRCVEQFYIAPLAYQ